jgi:hypothetical protein
MSPLCAYKSTLLCGRAREVRWSCRSGSVGRVSGSVGQGSDAAGRESGVVGRENGADGRGSAAPGRESSAVGRESGAVGRGSGAVGRESSAVSAVDAVLRLGARGSLASASGRRRRVVGGGMLKVEGEDARMWYESACDKTQGAGHGADEQGRTGMWARSKPSEP